MMVRDNISHSWSAGDFIDCFNESPQGFAKNVSEKYQGNRNVRRYLLLWNEYGSILALVRIKMYLRKMGSPERRDKK